MSAPAFAVVADELVGIIRAAVGTLRAELEARQVADRDARLEGQAAELALLRAELLAGQVAALERLRAELVAAPVAVEATLGATLDGRTLTLTLGAASASVTLPIPLDRGVWKDGTRYEVGDLVTWAGALWLCQAPTTRQPRTDAWRLAVKGPRE